jgi:hypothetical protein
MIAEEKNDEKKKKKSIWSGLFSVLDKLDLKKEVTRSFIFHPPKPGKILSLLLAPLAYTLEGKKKLRNFNCFEFLPLSTSALTKNSDIKIGGFKLFSLKKENLYMTPLIYCCLTE